MASSFVQGDTGLFKVDTTLGPDKLLLKAFRGTEGMSRLFHFDLDLLSEDNSISFTDIIGKSVTITIKLADGSPRYINGVISRFGQGGSDETFTSYHAELVPWLWFLTRAADCKIFQSQSVTDIIKAVFSKLGFTDFSDKTTNSYPALEYCVQYRETSFNFVSRLMEDNGIFYYFQHEDGKHTLVMGDDDSATADCAGQNQFRFYVDPSAVLEEDVVKAWHAEQELRTGKSTLTDYNFKTPSTSLLATTATIDTVGGNSQFDTYDYPGAYLTQGDGESLTKIRMQEEESIHLVVTGTSNGRSMATGYKFTLAEHYRDDMNNAYLLTDLEHVGMTTAYGNAKTNQQDLYSNSFRCIPSSVPFRPLRLTPRPTIHGPQPALVVGPSGEEIYTDQYGRVKVQFFWDRVGKKDENSSCWIRVSQFWAGKAWGAMFLPRMGQEVMVEFLEGDPDQPLVTGRVYNAEQTVPYTLPGAQTKSTIKTRSSKGGGTENYNEIRFEDLMGSEELFIHAEKDMLREVENNDKLTVGNNQTITIQQDRTETVAQGNESVTIQQGTRTHTVYGNESLTVQSGNRSVEVQQGNDTHTVDAGNRSATVTMGNDSLTVSMGNHSINVSMGTSSITAMQSITLTCGPSSITIAPSGVTISAPTVSISGDATVSISGGGEVSITGGMVMING